MSAVYTYFVTPYSHVRGHLGPGPFREVDSEVEAMTLAAAMLPRVAGVIVSARRRMPRPLPGPIEATQPHERQDCRETAA
ncbi:hypothetical protein [Methylobrevis pamukkalensis]|uniref:Uncharacterized protein n=1 Tax=Methylobrevis pamukkalensis TaxID=1439726 RepID=A0A1E3H1F7_9HYPH|nr:hypothetical protein [Methylobrevis pamukkalensis]ODN70132.1 hypothetical protein A6302_02554 [Methylobrevis pamukkalensis]